MKESSLACTDIDDRGLNTGQDGFHRAQVDVSEQFALVGPVEHHLDQLLVFHERDPRFVGRSTHEDFSPHFAFSPGQSLMTNPAGALNLSRHRPPFIPRRSDVGFRLSP